MGKKDDRLQIRLESNDKEFFRDFCAARGGMTRYMEEHIQYLRKTFPPVSVVRPKKGEELQNHPDFSETDEQFR